MDDAKYERQQRAFHSARTSAVMAGAIAAFIAFIAFELGGFAIAEVAVWMFALALLAASGTYIAVYLVMARRLRQLAQMA